MRVNEGLQAPQQPIQQKVAAKVQGQAQAQELQQKFQEGAQAPKATSRQILNPPNLGQNLDIKG